VSSVLDDHPEAAPMYPIIDLLVSMHGYVQDEVIAPIAVACF
jgi:hypothetical protein